MRAHAALAVMAVLTAKMALAETDDVEKGKEIFRACQGCHNTSHGCQKIGSVFAHAVR